MKLKYYLKVSFLNFLHDNQVMVRNTPSIFYFKAKLSLICCVFRLFPGVLKRRSDARTRRKGSPLLDHNNLSSNFSLLQHI